MTGTWGGGLATGDYKEYERGGGKEGAGEEVGGGGGRGHLAVAEAVAADVAHVLAREVRHQHLTRMFDRFLGDADIRLDSDKSSAPDRSHLFDQCLGDSDN